MGNKAKDKNQEIRILVYMKNGNVFSYKVDNAFKAREHAYEIWQTGFRVKTQPNRHEWFSPDDIKKIAWEGSDETYLAEKYQE